MSIDNVSLKEAVSGVDEQQAQVENTQEGIVQEAATETSDAGSEASTNNDDIGESEVKPKKGFEKRISKVVSERDRARQELEYWREQALKSTTHKIESQPQVDTSNSKPSRDLYETDEQYLEALSDYKVNQRLNEREVLRQQQALVENYNTRAKEFAKERPDFFNIIEDASDLVIAPETAYIIQSSEQGPKIALYLAENPDEADRLNRLDATRRVYELGKLESKLTTSVVKKTETKKVSTAPQPMTPTKGQSPGASKDLYDPTLTTQEWIALRMKKGR